jgi:[ribosomal protein S18]-alanine N-acetyltransferase
MLGWLFPRQAETIRLARTADAAPLAALHAEGFERGWGAQEFEALLADRSVLGHVACPLWGRPSAFILSRKAADEAEILSIVVARKARGQGFARRLLAHHISALAQARARRLFLEVEAGNEPALRLYRGFLFAEIGRRRAYYRKPDGSAADALMMARDL